ncbi:hypothetical protein ACTA71_012316 [Dictyostelium dimigraforme]
MESWQKILGIIEFAIVLIVLLFLIGVMVVIIKNRKLEFNMYWKSRALLASSAFIWVVFLMLGNEYLWNTDGLFGIKSHSAAICGLHLFFTVGLAEPLFFLAVLFTLKSKTNRDKDRNNYGNNNQSGVFRIFKNRFNFQDPNDYVYLFAFICSLPLIIVHIVLLILDALNDKVNIAYTVFDNEESKCLVPIVSTAAFAIFYVLFLLFFIIISRKFSKTIINRSLINRIRLLQFSFIAFLPLEVAIKVVLIFTLNIGKISQALFNAFFFVDIVVLLIGVLEFALFPILDSLGYYSSSIKLWKFKFLNRNNNEGRDIITNDGGGRNHDYDNKNDEHNQNISLTTISTNISSSTPNSLIPIGDYEKQLKNNNNNNNNNINNNNINNLEGGDNKNHILSQQTELEKLKIKHKSPILDRVRDTEPINLPPSEPLSTPLSSSPSQQPTSHERKKSRRFSLSGKKKSPTSTSSSSSSSPNNQSPPLQSQQSQPRYLQPTPVDDFKNNLFKYSQTGYK